MYKTGICKDCAGEAQVKLIAGRCNFHYWQYRAAVSKQKKPAVKVAPKPIKKVSDKRAKEQKIYTAKRIIFLAARAKCEAGLLGCTKVSTDVHHMAGRISGNYLNEATWKALCRDCHKWAEENPADAKELGLSISRH